MKVRLVARLARIMAPPRQLKESGIEAELKVQEFGAYASTTALGKFGCARPSAKKRYTPPNPDAHSAVDGRERPPIRRRAPRANKGKA